MDKEASTCYPSQPLPNVQEAKINDLSSSAEQSRDLCEPAISESTPLINVEGAGRRKRCGHVNWKNLIATVVLWVMYLFVSAAYSMIGPFFPSEVGRP